MRLVSGVSATVAIAAAALAGCSSGGSGTTSASGTSSPTSVPRGTVSTAPAGTSATNAGSTGTSGNGSSGSGNGTTSSGSGTTSSTACKTSQLTLRVLEGATDSTTNETLSVQLTDSSSRTCTLYGFPGVELIGGVGGTPKPLGMKDNWTLKLAETPGGKKVQTLKPGDASAASITWATRDPGASADVPRAQEVQVIPPNQRTALTARIFNVETETYDTPLVLNKTLNVGPMDINGVPHK